MRVTVAVIGAGHAGLAMSRRLSERSIDHVVIERGEVANSWRTERWESLRLLTPNWMNRLPGGSPVTGERDGFLAVPQVVSMLTSYARDVEAPVITGTTVTRLGRTDAGYSVATDRGVWQCRSVVLATGACNVAHVPEAAGAVPAAVRQVTPLTYRSPHELAEGGVLIVGASATGVQLADEIQRSGRPVTLAVGEHVRMPRRYRGRDVMWWMDAAGVLDERWDEVDDLVRARSLPSPQLIGSPDGRTIDLDTLQGAGVRLVGRLGAVRDGVAQFSGSLPNVVTLADLKLCRLLERFDDWARASEVDGDLGRPDPIEPTRLRRDRTLEIDLHSGEIATVVWAAGYRPDLSWLDVPALDRRGRLRHVEGAVTGHPGLYVLGAPLQRTRRSTFIDGASADTEAIAARIARRPSPTTGVSEPRRL